MRYKWDHMSQSMYWPRNVSMHIQECMSKCDRCMFYLAAPSKETIHQHEFPPCPWAKIGADLCDFDGHILVVL